jgi:xylan 1,4-beta-xylosidase
VRFSALFLPLLLASSARAQQPAPAEQQTSPVSVQVDLAHPIAPYIPIYSWFGYDEANYTTAPNGRALLRELHDLSPVPVYIRAHHLLTSGDGTASLKWSSTGVFSLDSAGHPVYNFTILDGIFDAWRKAGVRPFVELGFMPKDLASGTGPYQLPYPKTVSGSVQSPPKDYAMWGELIYQVTHHLVERYGAAEVATWYFEVWNEADISYWHGTPAEYLRLYDYSVAGVRRALPTARVGGPASTGPGGERAITFLTAFLNHCAHDKSAATGGAIPLDFISFHPKGNAKLVGGHVRMGLGAELNAAANGFRVVSESPFSNLPIVLSEADPEGCAACSAQENPANGYRNGPLYAAYTAVAMKSLIDLAAQYNVNLAGMVTWSFEFEGKKPFEGFRTLATNGVDKPVLNVFRMAGLLGGERVQLTSSGSVAADQIRTEGVRRDPDVDGFATHSGRDASVMLWNYYEDDVAAPGSPVELTISHVPEGIRKVLVESFRIDTTHSNAYTAWQQMGSPESPTPEQYQALKAAGQLQTIGSPEWVDVGPGGTVNIPMNLQRQATALVRLSW